MNEEIQRLSQEYDAAVEAYRNDESEENKAAKDELAVALVEARQAERYQRQGYVPNGGVAEPEAVEGEVLS